MMERVPMRWHVAVRAWLLIGLVMRIVVVRRCEDWVCSHGAEMRQQGRLGTFLTGSPVTLAADR